LRFYWCLLFPILVSCATVPPAEKALDPCSKVDCVPHDNSSVKVKNGQLIAAAKQLTPQLAAIQSFDVSLERREVVFSAKRGDNFDIGLVSLDGSEIHWFPSDPADEIDVQWAPRGNKVSYIVRTKSGDVVRTVHVPTATQLSVDFPYATIRALAWDRAAERYAVVVSSPDASDRIESMKYDGTGRRTDVASVVRLDVTAEPLAGALMLRPAAMHYGEHLPLVVWVANPPYVWNAERGALMREKRVACAIMRSAPDDAFWTAMRATPWIDSNQMSVRK
jgi:hypothetical protein